MSYAPSNYSLATASPLAIPDEHYAGQDAAIGDILARLDAIETFIGARAVFTSPAVETNSTTTPQTKISGTTPNLPAGTYEYTVSFGWNYNAINTSAFVDFTIDSAQVSTTTDRILRVEPKESGGNNCRADGRRRAGNRDRRQTSGVRNLYRHARHSRDS